MSAVKPIIREVREAVLTGFAHSKDKLHQLTRNMDDHLDGVIRGIRDKDKFDQKPDTPAKPDGPNRPDGSGTPGDGQPYTHGVRFFGPDQLDYYTRNNATLGRDGSAVFMMPAEDAVSVTDPLSAVIESGMAPSVTDAWRNGDSVYGALIPVDHLPQRTPTFEDAGGFEHYLPGGQTAVNIGGEHFVNPTREFVVDGGTPLPPGTVVFELGPGGTWDILGIYG